MHVKNGANQNMKSHPLIGARYRLIRHFWLKIIMMMKWLHRHFAKFEDGVVYTWDDGKTSWSLSSLGKVDWKYAKLAEESNG